MVHLKDIFTELIEDNTCGDDAIEILLNIDLEPIGMGKINISKNLMPQGLNRYYTAFTINEGMITCLLYTSPSPRDP